MRSPLILYKESFSGLSRPVWLLSLVMLINRAGTMVIPFLTIYLTSELYFTKVEAGIVMSVFGVGSVAGSMLGGYLCDRVGYFKVMFVSLFLSGFGFYSLLWADTFNEVAIQIFCLSVISESFRPAAQVAIGAYSKPENRLMSISLLRLSINLGFAFGPFIGGLIAQGVGYGGLFIVDGTTCIAASIFFLFILSPKKVPLKDKDDDLASVIGDDRRPSKDRTYLAFLFWTLVTAIVFMHLFSVFPVYLKEVWALKEHQVGLLMGLNGLIIVIYEMPLVAHLFNFIGWIGVLLISTLFVTFGEILFMPFSNTWAINWAPKARSGRYMSWFTMVYSVAHIVSPAIGMGVAERFGFTTLWYLLAFLCLLSGLGYLSLKKSKNIKLVEMQSESI
jgi:MFS family permease